jgi:flavin-dependent dehydrogenase
MKQADYDAVIIGAGLAGLQCARLLALRGAKILLVDRKTDLGKGIHTTGIFVRKTFEDFQFPPETLGAPVRNVTLYSPQMRPLRLSSPHDEFRVGRMRELYQHLLNECVESGAIWSPGTRYVKAETSGPETVVHLETVGAAWQVKTKCLIGSDGAQSRVARDLGLDENCEWIVGYEEVWRGVPLSGDPRLHCFLDAKLSPGYLAWVTNDGEDVHIGVGGYADRFNPREALAEFREKVNCGIGDLAAAAGAVMTETRGGRIPVGGVLKHIANERGLLIGDASGAVSPLTAGGLDPCLRLSTIAADVVWDSLQQNDPAILKTYSGELFRARFVSRIWMRRLLAAINNQTLLEFGCALLRLPLVRNFAAHVFFGRGSFPDDVKLEAPAKPRFFFLKKIRSNM